MTQHFRRIWIGTSIAVMLIAGLASCAAPRPGPITGATPAAASTRGLGGRGTRTPNPQAGPALGPSAGGTPQPTATQNYIIIPTPAVSLAIPPTPAPPATFAPTAQAAGTTPPVAPQGLPAQSAVRTTGGAINPLLTPFPTYGIGEPIPSIDPRKYPAPVLLAPDDQIVYHVSQPIVHFAWTNTPSTLLIFGQLPQCSSDATTFRKVFESNQLVVRSLDGSAPDVVEWTDTGQDFDINLTTLPSGKYAWSVNIVAVCESYVIREREKTIDRTLLGAVSPWSAPRTFTWIP